MSRSLVEVKDSKAIKALGYDKKSKSLYVQFHNNKDDLMYIYPEVEESLYEEFKNAEIKGRFFANIKRKLKRPRKVEMGAIELKKQELINKMDKVFKKPRHKK